MFRTNNCSESVKKTTPPNEKLVRQLMSTDSSTRQAALIQVLDMRNKQALNSVEDAIKRLTGKQFIQFYTPKKLRLRMDSPQEVYNQILSLAREGKFSNDPAFIQSLIPGVAFLNQDLMKQLAIIDTKAFMIYQLLGIQMQLKLQIG